MQNISFPSISLNIHNIDIGELVVRMLAKAAGSNPAEDCRFL
jgi:hypothetical protein